jgi:cbb3-type cytochrome oxidase subunit 3
MLVIFIATVTHMYRKSAGFDKEANIITPDKEEYYSEIKALKDKAN